LRGADVIRAFVFDLDGTLVETEKLKALSYARAATELRPELNEGEVVAAFGDFVGLSRQEVAVGLMRRLVFLDVWCCNRSSISHADQYLRSWDSSDVNDGRRRRPVQ